MDMENYVKPLKIYFDPSLCLEHININDLSREDTTAEAIAYRLIKTSESLKHDEKNVVVSNIIPRGSK